MSTPKSKVSTFLKQPGISNTRPAAWFRALLFSFAVLPALSHAVMEQAPITSINDPGNFFGGLSLGDTVSADFTIAAGAAPSNSNPNELFPGATSHNFGPPSATGVLSSFDVNGTVFNSPFNQFISLANDFAGDATFGAGDYYVFSQSTSTAVPFQILVLSLFYWDEDGTALNDQNFFALDSVDGTGWDNYLMRAAFVDISDFSSTIVFSTDFNSLATTNPVPLPGALVFFASALIGGGFLKNRRNAC